MRPSSRQFVVALACLSSAPALQAQAVNTDAGQLSGVVVDAQGEPLTDARIIIAGRGVVAQTDLRGTFRVANLPTADALLFVQRPGYESVLFSATPRLTDTDPLTIPLAAASGSATQEAEAELYGTRAELARRVANGQSVLVSSERLARYSTLDAAVRATEPDGFASSRGCLFYGLDGGLQGETSVQRLAALNAAHQNERTSLLAATAFRPGDNGIDYGDSSTGVVSAGSIPPLPQPPGDRNYRPRVNPAELLALEFIPAATAAKLYPGIAGSCGVVQVWR